MFQPGKINDSGLKILQFCVRAAALQEIRWHGQGQINKMYNHTLFFSTQLGTGCMIKMKMKKNLTGLEVISERL
jgi:hypothetical protein